MGLTVSDTEDRQIELSLGKNIAAELYTGKHQAAKGGLNFQLNHWAVLFLLIMSQSSSIKIFLAPSKFGRVVGTLEKDFETVVK